MALFSIAQRRQAATRQAHIQEHVGIDQAVATHENRLDDLDADTAIAVKHVYAGNGDPEGVQVAPIGSIYLRTDPPDPDHLVYVKWDETLPGTPDPDGWTSLAAFIQV